MQDFPGWGSEGNGQYGTGLPAGPDREEDADRRGQRFRRNDFTFTFHFHALEKEMATHSTVLAWRIPGTGEPGGLLSTGSHRVGHN